MNKFLVIILTPLIAVLLIALKVPEFEELIKKIDSKAPLYISVFLVLGTVFNYYVYIYAPYKHYERLAKNKWNVLDEQVQKIIKASSEKYDLTANIMVPKRRFFYWIEPKNADISKRRFKITGKVFDVIYQAGNLPIDKRLKFTTKQGICGVVYRSGSKTVGVDFTNINGQNDFNFNAEQIELTKGLVMLACCAITVKTNEINRQNSKTIGVVSFESKTKGSEIFVSERESWNAFNKTVEGIATLYSGLI